MTAILRARVVATPFYGAPGLKLIAEKEGPSLALMLIVAGFKDGDVVVITTDVSAAKEREPYCFACHSNDCGHIAKRRSVADEFAAAHCIGDDPSRPE